MTSGTGRNRSSGFGLIQAVALAGVVLILLAVYSVGLRTARAPCGSKESYAYLEVSILNQALVQYLDDERDLPSPDLAPDPVRNNDFPLLFEALLGERKPRGLGGRNSPYAELPEDRIVVGLSGGQDPRKATRDEIRDPAVKKYLLDPWGNPYIYRAGKTRSDAKIYSLGPNAEDDTVMLVENGDDIGNW
jgi:hypothetical protein